MKVFLKILASFPNFFYSIFSCIRVFVIIFFKEKNTFILLNPEGGFGPSLLKPYLLHVFAKKYKINNYLLVFGYDFRRHNKYTKYFFDKNFLWLNLNSKYIPFGIVNEKLKYLIFYILNAMLRIFQTKKRIYYFNEYFEKFLKVSHITEEKNNCYGSTNALFKFLIRNEKYSKNFTRKLDKYFNLNIKYQKKKCAIFIRSKGSNTEDFSSNLRDTSNVNLYYLAIQNLIKEGWQVFLTGDVHKKESWFDNFGNNLIYPQKFSNNDLYNAFVGAKTDCLISGMSGAVNYKFLDIKKPNLVIEGFPFGFGFYKSTMSFKFPKKSLHLKDVFVPLNLNYNKKYEIKESKSHEISKIIMEFIKKCKHGKVVGYMPNKKILNNNHYFKSSGAKISRSWMLLQNER
jgi:hypothetical protein